MKNATKGYTRAQALALGLLPHPGVSKRWAWINRCLFTLLRQLQRLCPRSGNGWHNGGWCYKWPAFGNIPERPLWSIETQIQTKDEAEHMAAVYQVLDKPAGATSEGVESAKRILDAYRTATTAPSRAELSSTDGTNNYN